MDGKQIASLIGELHCIHRAVAELRYRLRRSKKVVELASERVDSMLTNLKAKQEERQVILLDSKQKEHKAEIAALDLKRRYEQLDLASSEKQYSAIKLQIELDEKKNDELANEALEALSAVDEIEHQLEIQQIEINKANESLLLTQKKSLTEQNKLEYDIQRELGLLKETEQKLPRDFAGIYERLLKDFAGEEAFAPLLDKAFCSACDRQIPAEIVIKTSSGIPMLCPACGRLLYIS